MNATEGDDLIASVDYLFEFDAEVIEGRTPGLPKTNDILGSTIRLVRRAVGKLERNPPLDVRVEVLCSTGEVSAVERFVPSTDSFHVLLRNTPSPALRIGDFIRRV